MSPNRAKYFRQDPMLKRVCERRWLALCDVFIILFRQLDDVAGRDESAPKASAETNLSFRHECGMPCRSEPIHVTLIVVSDKSYL